MSSEFEAIYREFASLSHYPVEQFKPFKSAFPLLQNVACRHMKQLPPDLPFWNSAIPFLCILGKAKQPDFSNPDATNCLIALNTLHLLTHVLKANSYLDIDKSDSDDVCTLLRILVEILAKFQEPLKDKKAHIKPLCDELREIIEWIEKRNEDKDAFLLLLKKAIRNTKKCTHFIRDLFTCVFFNTDYEQLVPLVMQFFLDVQTVGVFECLADRYQEFVFNESIIIDGFRKLFIGSQDEAHQIFLDQSERYKASAQKQLNQGRVAIFCAAASKAAGVSAFELAKGSDDANVMRYFQSFVIPEYQPVQIEFSNSILTLLDLIIKKQPNHEITTQLTQSLASYTSDDQLKYICSAAAYFPDAELGYVSLMGAYLPVPLAQKISHLEKLIVLVSQAYYLTDTETRQYINTSGIELPSNISDIFKDLPNIKSLSDAEQSYAVILAINQVLSENGLATQDFANLMTNLSHVLCAWIISVASALQTATITFVPNAIATIEKNRCIRQDSLDTIHQAYDAVCQLQLFMATPVVINELLMNVSKSLLAILPLIEELIQEAPISLVDSEKEFAALLEFSEVALSFFEQLQRATVRIEFNNPIYLRHQVISIISPIYQQIQSIPTTLQTQPELVPQLIAETRMLLTSYMNTLYNVDRSVDIKALNDDFNRLSTATDPTIIYGAIEGIQNQLQMITTQANQVAVGKDVLDQINVNDNESLTSLIQMIANPALQAASYDLIKVLDECSTTTSTEIRTQTREQILNLITLRINGYQQLELSNLLALSDEDLKKCSIDIYASLPLYAGAYTHQVQELALPLLTQKDPNEMREALNRIVTYLTITLPLQEQLRTSVARIRQDPTVDFSTDLEILVRQLQLNVCLSQVDDTRLRSLFNAASLYSYSAKPVFNDEVILRDAELIFASRDTTQIIDYAQQIATNLIFTSIVNGHFSDKTLYTIKVLLKAADDYAKNPTESNHRAVYGAVLQLPSNLDKVGQMDERYLSLVAHALRLNQNVEQADSESFYTMVQPQEQTLLDCILAIPDPVAVIQTHRKTSAKIKKIKPPPQIIRRVQKKVHPPPPIHVLKIIRHIVKVQRHKDIPGSLTASRGPGVQDDQVEASIAKTGGSLSISNVSPHQRSSAALFNPKSGLQNANVLRCVKLVESARGSRDCLLALKIGFQEKSPNVETMLSEFEKISSFLISVVSESHDSSFEQLNQSLKETQQKVISLVNSNAPDAIEELASYHTLMHRLTRDVIFLCFQALGVTNNAQAELFLMTSKVDSLQSQLDDALLNNTKDMGPLQQRVASCARDLFKMTRDLGLEARAQTEFLQRSNQSVTDEKGLIKAAMQTSDAAQMFFLLLKLFAINDPDIKYKVVAACKGMRVALTNIIVNLRAKGGSNEIARRIENLSEQIFEKLQFILELAEELINQENTVIKQTNKRGGSMSIIVQRRNADSEVFKKRRALDEAESEIKRLNRAAAKTRGGA